MDFAQFPSASRVYVQSEEQSHILAVIYSVPVMFCIILVMFLYLFVQQRASASSPPQPTSTQSSSLSISVRGAFLKENIKDKLPTIVFDEELRARASLCCVCLGEFELKEELIQVPSCKHIFHGDCIGNWLSSCATCPLCRCSVDVVDSITIVLPPPQRSAAARIPAATSIRLASPANLAY
ncbi:hypothetical protein DCAR_0830714 [Daucus carota subsp. sativus]|uniref:RING-type E3 ubiquitin transferase n=1 Tax=Daucus carota subsp. sativus TaxID=79200 RepID=A0A175YL31_DAUCS|nr:hypothetical protein DCAR_0830714 [Daucus carota subsp. sativus]